MENIKPSKLENLERLLDFNFIFRAVLRLWWTFILVGALFGAIGYFYAKYSPVLYKSRLTFTIDDGNSTSNNIISLASELGLNMIQSSNVFNGENIINILRSRRIIENVLLSADSLEGEQSTFIEFYLNKSNFFKKNLNNDLHFPVNIKKEQLTYAQDSVLKAVYIHFADNLIKIDRPDKRLSIYQLEVKTSSEEFTKKFTDQAIRQANNFYVEIRTKKSKQTLDILEERTEEMKANLNTSITGKANVQDANLNPAFSKAQVPAMKQQTNIQIYGNAYAELFKNYEMAKFQYLNALPIMQIIDDTNYPMEKIKRGKLVTAIIFAVGGCFLLFITIWLRRIITVSSHNAQQ